MLHLQKLKSGLCLLKRPINLAKLYITSEVDYSGDIFDVIEVVDVLKDKPETFTEKIKNQIHNLSQLLFFMFKGASPGIGHYNLSAEFYKMILDDYMQYKTPILTPIELDILLDLKKFDDYRFDEILF